MGMDASSSPSAIRPSNKNDCPICGQPKTSWSLKCGTCEGNRQRYLAAITKAEEDRRLLAEVRQRGQSSVARDRHVSRQAVHQLVRAAQQRIDFLAMNPLPPVQVASV